MENYDHIIEGMLYIRGDEGLDIKEISVVLEVSKKKATELMDEFIEKYEHRGFNGIQVVNFGGKYKFATNPDYFPYYQKNGRTIQSKTFSSNFRNIGHCYL